MTARRFAALLVCVWAPAPLRAQLSVSLALGPRYTTTLVHDSIVTPLDVRPAIAPAFALTAATPLEQGWTVQAMLDVSSGPLERHDADGSTTGLGRVTSAAFSVGLRRELRGGISAVLAVGGLKYLPSEDAGIFRQGGGAIAPIGSLTLARVLPIAAKRLAVEASYDIHPFTTPALRAEGFHASRAVHRVAVRLRATLRGE